jgi:signal transduction histidine kinase
MRGTDYPNGIVATGKSAEQVDRRDLEFEENLWNVRSETFAANIQLGLVGLLFLIYIISPAPQDRVGDAMNATTQSLIVALLLSDFRRAVPGLMTRSAGVSFMVSAAEAATICYLIYSYHLQYALPLGAVLKSPTYAYFFVFIGLRAFSLRPGRVAFAGLAFALSWLALVYLASAASGDMPTTTSFSEYVLTGKLLIGAEIDKCIAVLLFTAVMALCTVRARSLIVRMVEQNTKIQQFEAQARADEFNRLTGKMAHEIRNPLNAMRAAAHTIDKNAFVANFDIAEPVERIKTSVSRCDLILTKLMEFTRQRSFKPVRNAIDSWLSMTVKELAAGTPDGVKIVLKPGAGSTKAMFDPKELRLAIGNLVENSVEALGIATGRAKASGSVTIRSEVDRGFLQLTVTDSGPGFAGEVRGTAHKPLVTSKGFGLGLGIPVAEQVCRRHGGTLEVDYAHSPGTRIVMRIPV